MRSDKKIDASGMTGALVALMAAETLRAMTKGEVLEVVADAHGVKDELNELASRMGVGYSLEGSSTSHFLVR